MNLLYTTKILAGTAAALAGFGIAWAVLGSRSSDPRSNPSSDERREANFYCPYGLKDKARARKAFLAAGVPDDPEIMHYYPSTRATTGHWNVFITLRELIAVENDLGRDHGGHGVNYDAGDVDLYEEYARYNRGILEGRSPKDSRSNPRPKAKPISLIEYLQNVDSYNVNPDEPWLAEIIRKAERFEEIKHPRKYTWTMYAGVPIEYLEPGTLNDYVTDGSKKDVRRYREIKKLMKAGGDPWPILVDQYGFVLDGYHRLAAMSDLGEKEVKVVVATPIDLNEG